ncbi:LOW QUALITY PROTEIN: VQ motif-containing protein 31-like [Salvia miltiorrhiza]|uniref:LOW QUALITY PROTEIN: VQ motif-containing protein 31-like n=1 Tax=Salvia miltiorrhiza TaxID=226208 RepID=UPI0025AC2206|nr:LOW QUALITY PROTEIN: VQ motif-containing protein 31-like [Salvia miltiorrhiza]
MEKQRGGVATPAAGFIQADAATFKDLVQRLTGAPGNLRPKAAVPFKLRERRKQSLGDLEIVKRGARSAGNSPAKGPATPLGRESVAPSEEERAIAEKGFYLHASPAKAAPPVLLTLFPLTP